jgi:predicted  nucleic acid-binding Zn-ribbon protein
MGKELPESIQEQKNDVESKLSEVKEAKEHYKKMKIDEDEHPRETQDAFQNLFDKLKEVIKV